ncbi:hypothetical protein Dimus_036137 [Dionaea muscipula]
MHRIREYETVDLESSHPMEPIEEENKAISGDNSGSSSNGDADSSESSIDEAIAATKKSSGRTCGGFPSSPVTIPTNLFCLLLGSHFLLTMGRKKKKRWMIPFSQWTPLVVGLSSDASESSSETSDLGNSFPIETLEEEIESSNGDSAASESSSDDEEAERHDVVADGANVSNKQTSISGIQLPPEILGFPEHHLHPDSGGAMPFEKSQVNPNPSISAMNLCSEVDLCSNEQDNARDLSLNHASLQESPCPRGFAPSTSLQTPTNHDNGNPDNGNHGPDIS